MGLDRSYIAQCLKGMTHEKFDANETAVFSRQLEHIMARTYKIEYAELKARSLFPVNREVSNAAESFTYRQRDVLGKAKIIENWASDFPTVEIKGAEFTHKLISFGDSFSYSIQDMRRAAMAGINLPSEKATAAREVIEFSLESLCVKGLDSKGDGTGTASNVATGFVNAANILTGQKTDQVWASEDVAGILADINKAQNAIFVATKGRYRGDTLLLGTSNYALLATTARSPTYTQDSLLTYILAQSPWLKSIEHWPALDAADPDTSKELVMLYQKNPMCLELIIAQEFEMIPPQPRNMAFIVDCHLRTGGVVVYLPKTVYRLEDTVA
jgi:hypothetical protein